MALKFYILENDYLYCLKNDKEGRLAINAETSVIAYKGWFLDCLRQFGRVILVNESKLKEPAFKLLLKKKDALFVSVNFLPVCDLLLKVPHRLLRLSLGALLLPKGLYASKCLPSAEVTLVSTKFQADRLNSYLEPLTPKMAVFSPKIETDYYVMPTKLQRSFARRIHGIKEGEYHIIYAGRWLVTKGICQLIRTLDIWPLSNIVLTLAGNVEEDNRIASSFAHHKTFSQFLSNELLGNIQRHQLRFQQAKDKKELRELFWSADLFVNLSIQPDENFGITPREAMSCGLPVLTTNFCGLQPLAETMPFKGVDTYPTLSGSRFSLKQFRVLLQRALSERNLLPGGYYRKVVTEECNPKTQKDNLKDALAYLLKRPPEKPLNKGITQRNIKKKLLASVDDRVFEHYIDLRKELPTGAYTYGDGPSNYAFSIAQGIYSAMVFPPKVKKGSIWRGFFRNALWEREKALIEFGFPGPRIRRYPKELWRSLIKSVHYQKSNEFVIIPEDKGQILITQELVDLGYLVSDDY